MSLDGIISYIPTHFPIVQELGSCEWVELTSSKPWDPKLSQFAEDEEQKSLNTITLVMKETLQHALLTPVHATPIGRETGTDLWQKAIEKEVSHVKAAFNILDEDAPEPIGSKRIPCLVCHRRTC